MGNKANWVGTSISDGDVVTASGGFVGVYGGQMTADYVASGAISPDDSVVFILGNVLQRQRGVAVGACRGTGNDNKFRDFL